MNRTKWIAIAAAAVLTTGLLTGTALAEGATSGSTTAPKPPAKMAAREFRTALQADEAALRLLQAQGKDLAKQVHTQEAAIKSQLAGHSTAKTQDKALRDQLRQALADKLKPLQAQAKALQAQLKDAKAAKDQAKVKDLTAQLATLKSQAKAQLDSLSGLRDQVKTAEAAQKAAAASRKALHEQLQPMLDQVKATKAQLTDLHKSEQAAQQALHTAVQAKDQAAAQAALAKASDLQRQINSLLQQALTQLAQVAAALPGSAAQ